MPLAPADLVSSLRWRYATKQFDPNRKIPADVWEALEESLILTPSSYGLQPWRFVVVTTQTVKEQLVSASWRQKQPAECSHHVVFAVSQDLSEGDIDGYIARIADIRQVTPESLAGFRKMLLGTIIHGMPAAARAEWAIRQAYIALGNLMTSAALLGVDTCPMEGIEPEKYDDILGLQGTGYTTCVACAVGYRAESDRYAALAKVRHGNEQVILRR